MTKLESAIEFSLKAHSGQTRKFKKVPYLFHAVETATIVSDFTEDEDILSAAVLHDTLEDTSATFADIEREFGERVAKLVLSHTEIDMEDKSRESSWMERKEESLQKLDKASYDEKLLWVGDKLSNLRSFYREYLVYGDKMFEKLHQKDKNMHKWYYQRIVDDLKPEFAKSFAFMELEELYNRIFCK